MDFVSLLLIALTILALTASLTLTVYFGLKIFYIQTVKWQRGLHVEFFIWDVVWFSLGIVWFSAILHAGMNS